MINDVNLNLPTSRQRYVPKKESTPAWAILIIAVIGGCMCFENEEDLNKWQKRRIN